ncbi:MAG: hypothetical protein H6817_03400 [Phycisphaerales bacterium]|nr:hypothetical protein [Phycisphaerales bacterium]
MRCVKLAILFGMIFAAGCASAERAYIAPVPVADTRLLFDAQPGYPQADQIAYASDWPSTDAVIQGRERIFYRESIYDLQGIRGNGRDLTFRRFRVERVGEASR